MGSKEIGEISFVDLKLYTNNFSQENFIGNFQFGKVYRGLIGDRGVTVKIWVESEIYFYSPGDNEARMDEELLLHTDPRIKSHPNLAKLIAYCREGQLGVVYDLNPVDTLRTFILRDDFTWSQGINVALQFACILEFLHTPCPPLLPYLVRGTEATHFLLDKDYSLVLYEFGMFSGGVLPDRSKRPPGRAYKTIHGCLGYIDLSSSRVGEWSEDSDVWAFGVILVGLISRKVFIVEDYIGDVTFSDSHFVDDWAIEEHERRKLIYGDKVSLVHQSFEADSDFKSADGIEVTKLAMQCLDQDFEKRPLEEEVVQSLSELLPSRTSAFSKL